MSDLNTTEIRTYALAVERKKAAADAAFCAEHPPACCECGGVLDVDAATWCRIASRTHFAGLLCPDCQAADAERRRAAGAERERRARARAEERERQRIADLRENIGQHLTRIGVPGVLAGADFDRCPDVPGKIVEAARRWAANPRRFLVLSGPCGSGKSWLAVAALRAIMLSGRHRPDRVLFATEAAFMAGVENDYGTIRRDDRLAGAGLLLYDDLGAAYRNDMRREQVEELIRERYNAERATIITSNLTAEEIGQAFGARTLSVLLGSKQFVRFPAADLRQNGSVR